MTSATTVYVLELNVSDGTGYTSVHRTFEGAHAKLLQRVDDLGLQDALAACESGNKVEAPDCTAAGEYGDELTYGISRLTVEE